MSAASARRPRSNDQINRPSCAGKPAYDGLFYGSMTFYKKRKFFCRKRLTIPVYLV
jgi:hypothetical protein